MNANYDLPPIRKIGPAVLPKPKNIKIQAGRVIRLNTESKQNQNEKPFTYNKNNLNEISDFILPSKSVSTHIMSSNPPPPPPPPPPLPPSNNKNGMSDYNSIQKNLTSTPVPHRARLVQIPVSLESVQLNNKFIDNNNNSSSFANNNNSSRSNADTDLKNNFSQSSIPINQPILSTSQFKFPRKNSSSKSVSPSRQNTSSNSTDQSINKKTSVTLPATYIKTGQNEMQPTTINVSSDGNSNRPTITITTSRGPNSPTLSLKQQRPELIDNDVSLTSNGFTYNIPIQYVHQASQQPQVKYQLSNPSSPTRTNFIFTNQDKLNSFNVNNSNNTNSNTTYTIPVNMTITNKSTVNNNGNNDDDYYDEMDSFNNERNYNLTSGNLMFNPGQQQINLQQMNLHQLNNFKNALKNSNLNMNSTNSINTINRSFQNNQQTDVDQVDLLKDLLVKNLNASNDPNFYGICMRCNEKIFGADNGLRAMDQLFHTKCFNCYSCGYSLQGRHFYAMDNNSFCESCYMKLLETCSNCSKPITDRILRATGKPFHPECFCCIVCHKNLDGIPFTVDASNKIHCIECFHEKYAPRCFICHLPITPEPGQEETVRIVAMDKSFHVACYKCEDCGISLTSNAENAGGCFPLDDHIFCKNCNIQRIRKLVGNQDLFLPQELYSSAYKQSQQQQQQQQKTNRNRINSSSNLTPRSTDL